MKGKRGTIFAGILIAEVLALILTCACRLRRGENDQVEYPAQALTMARENGNGMVECSQRAEIGREDQGKNRRIITPALSMRRGVYAVSVDYVTDTRSHSSEGCHSQAVCEDEYPWIRSESVMLTDRSVNAEYFVYVAKDNTDVKIKNIMDDKCSAQVQIQSITVTYLKGRSALRDGAVLLMLFGLADLALYLYLFRRQAAALWIRKNYLVALGFVVLLFLTQLPMTMNYVPKGYDMRFHYYRIYTIAEGLRDGSFPVKIQPEWFNGYGYATGVFYGDVLLYLPAFLYCMGFPLGTAYRAYVLFINLITLGNAYLCFRTISRDKYIGLLGTAVYAMSLHRLVALFTRAALGAYTVMAFWPLLILGLWAIYYGEEKEYRRGWVYLVAGSAGIIGSHVLGTLMTILFAALLLILFFRETFQRRRLSALFRAAAGCLVSNLFFLVPFLDMYQSMTLTTYHGNKPLYYNSAFVSQLFSTAYNAVADVKADLKGMYQDMPMSVGPASGLVLLAALCLLVRGGGMERKDRSLLKRLLALAFLSLWMSTNLFPYMWLDEYVPAVYEVLSKFEFAWRFLGAATVFIVLLYIFVLGRAAGYFGRRRALAAGAVVCALFCWQGSDYLFQYNNLMIPFEFEDSFRDLTVKAVYDGAYLPEETDYLSMTADIRVSDPDRVSAALTAREGTSLAVSVENSSEREEYVDLPLLKYKGYYAESAGRGLPVSCGENNRLRVAVPPAFSGTVYAAFAEPWYWRAAEIVSAMFWIWLVFHLARKGE